MRYLLIVILLTFSGCATVKATQYDKKQDQVLKLASNSNANLLASYTLLKKAFDKEKKSNNLLKIFVWNLMRSTRQLYLRTQSNYVKNSKLEVQVAYLLKELEKLKKFLRYRVKKGKK